MKLERTNTTVIDGVEVFPIPSLFGRYGISKCGRVWSFDRSVSSGNGVYVREGQWKAIFRDRLGYAKVSVWLKGLVKGGPQLVHRLLAEVFLPDWHPECEVDHADGNKQNNALENLRVTNRSGNSKNVPTRRTSRSGLKGVYLHRGGWQVRIMADRKDYYLGRFHDPVEAALAYDVAARKLHGEFAFLNFPDQAPR